MSESRRFIVVSITRKNYRKRAELIRMGWKKDLKKCTHCNENGRSFRRNNAETFSWSTWRKIESG